MKKEKIICGLDEAQQLCLCLILFFLPISSAIIEVFAAGAMLFFILKKLLFPGFNFLRSKLMIPLLCFFVLSSLSLLNSDPYLIKSMKAIIFKWSKYIALFLLVADSFNRRERIKNAIGIIIISSFLVGIDGISQRLFHLEFLRGKNLIEMKPSVFAITASFNHYNSLGSFLVMVLPLMIAFLFAKEMKKKYKVAILFVLAILLMCLFLTFSRGSWVGFVLSLLLMAFLTKRIKAISAVFAVFLTGIMIHPSLRERLLLIFTPSGDANRFLLWKAALKMMREHPLIGNGAGTFMDRVKDYNPLQWAGQYAHNCFLQMGAETGIFALSSFIIFICFLLYRSVKRFKLTADFVLLGFICGIFGFLVHCFFDVDLYSLQLSYLFWFFTGLTYCLSVQKKAVIG